MRAHSGVNRRMLPVPALQLATLFCTGLHCSATDCIIQCHTAQQADAECERAAKRAAAGDRACGVGTTLPSAASAASSASTGESLRGLGVADGVDHCTLSAVADKDGIGCFLPPLMRNGLPASQYNTLQHNTARCNTAQRVATYSSTARCPRQRTGRTERSDRRRREGGAMLREDVHHVRMPLGATGSNRLWFCARTPRDPHVCACSVGRRSDSRIGKGIGCREGRGGGGGD
jgi:hypothetical protein